MRSRWCAAALAAGILLLTACGQGGGETGTDPDGTPGARDPGGRAQICARVVSAEEDRILLAGLDLFSGAESPLQGVYAVDPADWDEVLSPGQMAEPGALAAVGFDGSVEETLPARLGNLAGAVILPEGFDNLCVRYLEVLEDLWEEDPALNHEAVRLGFDLSGTRLAPSEQEAVILAFSSAHGDLPAVTGSLEELMDRGIIDRENLYWTDGVHLSIRETGEGREDKVTFEAEKWRSGLGAVGFTDCTSVRDGSGRWSAYRAGGSFVS